MNENLEQMENNMEELKISMFSMLLHTIDERISKRDVKMYTNKENV